MKAATETTMTPTRARLTEIDAVKDFVLAGNARVTLASAKTGARFTYWIRGAIDTGFARYFVRVLVGSENDDDRSYAYLGVVFNDGSFRVGRKSTISAKAPSAIAFAFFWSCLRAGALNKSLEVWHEGRCGRCGHVLTVPESIASGIGPKCAGKVGA